MEGGNWGKDLNPASLMPDSALCAEDRIDKARCKIVDKLESMPTFISEILLKLKLLLKCLFNEFGQFWLPGSEFI